MVVVKERAELSKKPWSGGDGQFSMVRYFFSCSLWSHTVAVDDYQTSFVSFFVSFVYPVFLS